MSYVEIAVSDGPGTLVKHFVRPKNDGDDIFGELTDYPNLWDGRLVSTKHLTEQEALEWKDIHGGWVAV